GSNALKTAHGVYARMQELKARFPEGLDYKIVYDTTPFIDESVHEVYSTLIDAVILVAIVVLGFLQDWRAMSRPRIDGPGGPAGAGGCRGGPSARWGARRSGWGRACSRASSACPRWRHRRTRRTSRRGRCGLFGQFTSRQACWPGWCWAGSSSTR